MTTSTGKLGRLARTGFFAVLPAVAAGGAMALPVLISAAGAASARPSLLRQAVEKPSASVALLVVFTAWAILSGAWSAYPALPQGLKLAVLVPLGLAFAAGASDCSGRRLTLAGGLAAFLALAVLLAIEAGLGLPLNRAAQPEADLFELGRNMTRGATVLLGLSWAGAAWLVALGGAARLLGAGAVLIASAALALPFGQLAHAIAVGVGLCAFALAFAAPRAALLLTTGGLAGWTLLAPFVTPLALANPRLIQMLPDSWAVRAGIWEYACARIADRPWVGHGLDASRAVTDHIFVRGLDIRGIPLHPHSASLQIWYETGAAGAALAAGAIAFGGWALSRAYAGHKPAAAAAAASFASLGLMANVSYGLWQEWWIATMFVTAALVGALGSRQVKR